MKVCIDIQAAIAQRAGVGRYTKTLVEHLGPASGSDELSLFYFDFKRKGTPFSTPGAQQKVVRWCPGRYIQAAWKRVGWPPFDWFAGEADVYHFPNFIRPPLRKGKSVVTIHDVAFLRYPETIEKKNYRYLKSCIRDTVKQSDALIAVSKFTADEMHALLHVPRDKIVIVHEALDPGFKPPGHEVIAQMRKTLGLDKPYLLTVGTLEPRKNIPFLVEVFEQLEGFDGDLVIAGMPGWKCQPILDRLEQSSCRERIRYLKFVEEEHLPALYAGAELFVFPSLYEGFGFPPLEAMACGTPVLAADAGSLPEILGKGAHLVGGFDVGHWAEIMGNLLADTTRRDKLLVAGTERVKSFSWERAAAETWDVYRQLGS